MSHRKLRPDHTCANCGYTVDKRYCSNCGQENIEIRQSFRHLAVHFFEDLTHYEGKFWVTLKSLFFRPAYLTNQYLSGKVSSFLPPVRLYIFVSFITFFLPHLIPHVPDDEHTRKLMEYRHVIDTNVIGGDGDLGSIYFLQDTGLVLGASFKTLHKLDSAKEARAHTEQRLSWIDYQLSKKAIALQHYSPYELTRQFYASLRSSFPKALFLYLPVFAFIVFLFHSRKKWIYFDHAIFVLHYFSFVLLAFCCYLICGTALEWAGHLSGAIDLFRLVNAALLLLLLVYYAVYFYRAHRIMYGESWVISVVKSTVIFSFGCVLLAALIALLVIITIFSLH